jgi:hypothetical protein
MTTTRTLQFFGQAYGDTPVTLVASIDGTELFNGTVSTIVGTAPLGLETADQVLLFTVSFPGDAEGRGAFPMTVAVNGGDSAVLGIVKANYEPIADGSNKGPDIFGPVFNGDARSNVAIDGVVQPLPVVEDGKKGSYAWVVHSGSTISCNLNLA